MRGTPWGRRHKVGWSKQRGWSKIRGVICNGQAVCCREVRCSSAGPATHTIWSFNHTSLASLPLVTCRSIYTCCHILSGLPGVIKDQEEWLYYPIASLLLLLSSFVRTSIYKSICQLPVKSPRNFPFLVAVGSSFLTWWLLPPTMAKNPSATHRKKEATEARVGKWESWPAPRHPHWGGNKRVKK